MDCVVYDCKTGREVELTACPGVLRWWARRRWLRRRVFVLVRGQRVVFTRDPLHQYNVPSAY